MGKNKKPDGKKKLKAKKYEAELRKMQGELCAVQDWVKYKGMRVIIIFEGRDAAGKGGTIRAITERVSPRIFRTVALPAPSDREKSQMYMQRYMQHFPAAGEVVIFDRSWYNRAGVEYVMGFCTPEQHKGFLEKCPEIEDYIIEAGIILIKVWLEVSDKEQKRRFEARIEDPIRQWKLSPMDLPSRQKWFEYSRARDMMLKATDTKRAPWFILRSDDKKRARLNCIRHILNLIPHGKVPREKIKLPKRSMKHAYDDQTAIAGRKLWRRGIDPSSIQNFKKKIGWVILGLVAAGCLLVLLPFASALLWAVVLSFSCWPLYSRLVKALGGRRNWAALVMMVGMFCVILLPFVIVGATLGDSIDDVTVAVRKWMEMGPPPPPEWLGRIPVVGVKAAAQWKAIAGSSSKLTPALKRVIEPVSGWLLRGGLALGRGLLELALSILIAFFLLRDGSATALRVATAMDWVAGDRGRRLLELAGKTVRGVVYGILGTAIVQSVMAGIGFLIAGVPGAGLLALLTFFLSVVPVGPPLIWVPATLWLFHQGSTGWGIFMLVWGVGVSSVDNVVKPWLISQGSDMPFLLIFFGVLGGALAFGFIGVFIGPTLLAVGYRLVQMGLHALPSGPP